MIDLRPAIFIMIGCAVSASPVNAACNIVGGKAYGDCSGVTINQQAQPYKIVVGFEVLTGVAEGATVRSGGSLLATGIIDKIQIERGGKSTREITKSKSKRALETGTPVLVRLQAENLEKLDEWRRHQPDIPGRPEAIRRLLEFGLKSTKVRK
jgi:hypothetical protein